MSEEASSSGIRFEDVDEDDGVGEGNESLVLPMNRGTCCAGRTIDDRVELGESGAFDDGDRPI